MSSRRQVSKPQAYIPGPESKAKRDRSWEAEQRKVKGAVTYRGIPAELNEELKAIAEKLDVPVGEVARAFLELGVREYTAGRLELHPSVKRQRYGLYHE